MDNCWDQSKDVGIATNADYPYVGVDQDCAHDDALAVSQVDTYGTITTTIDDAILQLHSGPMTIAVVSGDDCWRYYSSGVLSSADRCGSWPCS